MKTTDLEVKTDLPAEMKTERLELIIEGVRVRVRLDEQGRPVTVSSGCWKGGDAERITRLALEAAQWRLKSEAEQRAKAAHDATRTANSTETRRKKSREHWTREWLEAAHNAHPDYGADRLMVEARKIAALNGIAEGMRDQITKDRARKYLETVRSK